MPPAAGAATPPPVPPAAQLLTPADAARVLGMRVEVAASVEAGLRTLAAMAYDAPPRILITGSLYLAGAVLAANGQVPD